jgi:hypothetical protein
MGMNRLGLGRRPEESCHLRVTLLFRFFREGQVFPVRLGLPGKGFFQILFRLGHKSSL